MIKQTYIQKAVEELNTLLPVSFSIGQLQEWTGVSKSTLRRYLQRHCEKEGKFKTARYKLKEGD